MDSLQFECHDSISNICFNETFACADVFFPMISFRGSVYITFYILSPVKKINFCQNDHNEIALTFCLGVFHLSCYKRLNRQRIENILFCPK